MFVAIPSDEAIDAVRITEIQRVRRDVVLVQRRAFAGRLSATLPSGATLRTRVATTFAPQPARILAVSYPSEPGDAPVTITWRPDISTGAAIGLRRNNRARCLTTFEKLLGMSTLRVSAYYGSRLTTSRSQFLQ